MAQPDFGTGATYVPILAVGILLAGVQWRYVVLIVLACALARRRLVVLKDFRRSGWSPSWIPRAIRRAADIR